MLNTREVPFVDSYLTVLKSVDDIQTEYFWFFANFMNLKTMDLNYIPEQHERETGTCLVQHSSVGRYQTKRAMYVFIAYEKLQRTDQGSKILNETSRILIIMPTLIFFQNNPFNT